MFNRIYNHTYIIDVRDKQEHLSSDKKIIDRTINIPLNMLEKEMKKRKIAKDTQIMVFCQSGKRSKVATDILKQMGYTNVTNIGGIDDVNFLLK